MTLTAGLNRTRRNKAAMNIICTICRQQFFVTTKAPQSVPTHSFV